MKTKILIAALCVGGLTAVLMAQDNQQPIAVVERINNVTPTQVRAVLNDLGQTNYPAGAASKIVITVAEDGSASAVIRAK